MTYTYELTTDRGKVRLAINDTDTTAGKLTDAEIDYALTLKTTVGAAAVQCIDWLLAKVADPNFTADWLTVDNASAFKSLSSLRLLLCQSFGVPSLTTSSVFVYRADSRQTESPDYDDTDDDEDEDE
jgi:hypothetical protein